MPKDRETLPKPAKALFQSNQFKDSTEADRALRLDQERLKREQWEQQKRDCATFRQEQLKREKQHQQFLERTAKELSTIHERHTDNLVSSQTVVNSLMRSQALAEQSVHLANLLAQERWKLDPPFAKTAQEEVANTLPRARGMPHGQRDL
jgi:hypothetical protein